MARLLLPLLCLAGCAAWAQEGAPAEEPPAGKVEVVSGEVRVLDKARATRSVAVGDGIREGESVVTGADGELHMEMADGGSIAVRPNTQLRITAFRARGDDQDKSILNLVVGGFRSITGWIGKFNARAYQIRTPTATIGVRGTDHEPLVIPEGSSEGEAGTYDKVNVGASYIQSSAGVVEVPEQRAAFAPLAGRRLRPRLLDGIPPFFRPGRHEFLLERRHEAIQHLLEQRRLERRQFFERHPALRGRPLGPRAQAMEHRQALREARLRHLGGQAPGPRPFPEQRRPHAREFPAGQRPGGRRD